MLSCKQRPVTPTIRIPGNGRNYHVFDMAITCTVTSEDTAGAYSVFEQMLPAGGVVPSYLTHNFEVVCYVLEGLVSVQIGGQYLEAAAGTLLRIPPETAFSLRNGTEDAVKLLSIVTPGGMEQLFEDLAEKEYFAIPSRAAVDRLFEDYGIEMLVNAN
jgi:quercetin dioxygenase-like cupin family protein